MIQSVYESIEKIIGKHTVPNFINAYRTLTANNCIDEETATELLELCGLCELIKENFSIEDELGGAYLSREERTVLMLKRVHKFNDNIVIKWVNEYTDIELSPLSSGIKDRSRTVEEFLDWSAEGLEVSLCQEH